MSVTEHPVHGFQTADGSQTTRAFPTIRTPDGPIPADAPAWNPQRASSMPSHRYRSAYDKVSVPLTAEERTWPDNRFTRAPLWVPVDLRDGNQALAEPMDTPRKRLMFDLQVAMGFKEIEVGYPSASQTDFDFVRYLATSGSVPDDVTVSVFTPAKPDLIERTYESIAGLPNVLVHMYTATAPIWRDVVLGFSRPELVSLIRRNAELVMRLADTHRGNVRFQFSPEMFNLTEPEFILEVCNGLTELWDASPDRPVVHNLPATVEIGTPNIYADQIEYMHRHLDRRDAVILSVHPHNDHGTGVAAAELAVLAGAQRVEGCLFGNGERTGNVDLVTLAMNLHAQGVDPMVDFSDIDEIRRTVEHCNRIAVHERHPYGGSLVYTAFSGTHQDAIKKGMAWQEGRERWEVPYLPVDPADVGLGYEAVIRVNSQSGKGGIAWVLQTVYGLEIPRRMQPEFSRVVQAFTDASGEEAKAEDLWALFDSTYLTPGTDGKLALASWQATEPVPGEHEFACVLIGADGAKREYVGRGNGPLSAFTDALAEAGVDVDILSFAEHATGSGLGSHAATYVECRVGGDSGVTCWGAGLDTSVLTASVRAVLSAVNRA
jgi:2-isopropylmalate synthase